MKIEITKKQEIIDDVAEEPRFRIYTTKDKDDVLISGFRDCLYDLRLEDICTLRDRLNKDFPPHKE